MNKIENAVIRYAIDFEKYKNGQANAIIKLLDNADYEIAKYIKMTTDISTKKRYNQIAKKLKEISSALKDNIESGIDIDGVINYELKKQSKILDTLKSNIIKVQGVGEVNFLYPSVEQIKTSALFNPITKDGYGMTWQSFLNGIESGFYNTWDVGVRTGYLTGIPTKEIVNKVLGGVSKIDKLANPGSITSLRNSVYANTRTALQALANETQRRVYEENEQYFAKNDRYEYLATLDSRTCLVCGALDGKTFNDLNDEKFQPNKHRGCRCVVCPHFDIEGDTKASKDEQVDSKVSFNDWLKEQDEKTQLDVLGRTRFEKWKNGEVKTIDQYVENGKVLKLDDLKKKLVQKENEEESETRKRLDSAKVERLEIKKFEKIPTNDEIITRIAGYDKTEGSCSSVAFTYIANKGGYDVLDFRGGKSRSIFATTAYIKDIANLDNVESYIIKDYNDFNGVKKLLENVKKGKEYYLATGKHVAIIRKNDSIFEYLELQSEKHKGFHKLDDNILKQRFKCQKSHTSYGDKYAVPNILIEIASLAKNKEFLNLMSYINTNSNNQLKGLGGGMK